MPSPTHYVGIDPGFSGAVGLINAAGTDVRVWPIPLLEADKDRNREYDIHAFLNLCRTLRALPNCLVGVEWPTTRPGDGAERMERFGRGKGIIETALIANGLTYRKIAPNLWKGRLGVPGKTDKKAKRIADSLFHTYYPEHGHLVRGPRGGLLDGECDALLIAHYLRTQDVDGMKATVARFGKDSEQAARLVFRRSSSKYKGLRKT